MWFKICADLICNKKTLKMRRQNANNGLNPDPKTQSVKKNNMDNGSNPDPNSQ